MSMSKLSRMKLERLRRGWSQQELAVVAHVGVADVSRIETGRMRPYPVQGQKLGWALRLRPEELQQHVPEDEAAAVLVRHSSTGRRVETCSPWEKK